MLQEQAPLQKVESWLNLLSKPTVVRCSSPFILKTFVGSCPVCGGVHAVSPPCANDPANVQFAGDGFKLP